MNTGFKSVEKSSEDPTFTPRNIWRGNKTAPKLRRTFDYVKSMPNVSDRTSLNKDRTTMHLLLCLRSRQNTTSGTPVSLKHQQFSSLNSIIFSWVQYLGLILTYVLTSSMNFIQETPYLLRINRKIMIVMDGCSDHIFLRGTHYIAKNNISITGLLEHTQHTRKFYKKLGVGVFGPLKEEGRILLNRRTITQQCATTATISI